MKLDKDVWNQNNPIPSDSLLQAVGLEDILKSSNNKQAQNLSKSGTCFTVTTSFHL